MQDTAKGLLRFLPRDLEFCMRLLGDKSREVGRVIDELTLQQVVERIVAATQPMRLVLQ